MTIWEENLHSIILPEHDLLLYENVAGIKNHVPQTIRRTSKEAIVLALRAWDGSIV